MSTHDSHEQLFHQALFSVKLFFGVFILGALGFWIIGLTYPLKEGAEGGSYDPSSLLNALYMSAITVTTVGYGEAANFHELDGNGELVGEIYTTVFVIIAYVAVVYASANIVAALVEGAIGKEFQRRRMEKELAELEGHYIVCGAGSTGRHIIDEVHKTKNVAVVIDQNEAFASEWNDEENCWGLVGDATDDELLHKAGVTRAAGVFACLHDDKDNLFICLSARQANQTARIVGRATEPKNKVKFTVVGADSIISPNQIGGLRMASEMLRPSVVSFLDTMLRQTTSTMRFEEVKVQKGDAACGKKLQELNTAGAVGLNVVGIWRGTGDLQYNPKGDTIIEPGDSLIVITDADRLKKLREHTKVGMRR